jgi:hypothetical protein
VRSSRHRKPRAAPQSIPTHSLTASSGSCGPALPGATCPPTLGTGIPPTRGTRTGNAPGSGPRSSPFSRHPTQSNRCNCRCSTSRTATNTLAYSYTCAKRDALPPPLFYLGSLSSPSTCPKTPSTDWERATPCKDQPSNSPYPSKMLVVHLSASSALPNCRSTRVLGLPSTRQSRDPVAFGDTDGAGNSKSHHSYSCWSCCWIITNSCWFMLCRVYCQGLA